MCVKAIFRVIEGGVEGFQVCSRIAWAQAPRVLFVVCLGYDRPRTQLTTFVMSFPIPPPRSPVLEPPRWFKVVRCLGSTVVPDLAAQFFFKPTAIRTTSSVWPASDPDMLHAAAATSFVGKCRVMGS